MTIDAKQLLAPAITAMYEPPDLGLSHYFFHPNQPLFTPWHVDAMLSEPRIKFGLDLLRGPILTNSSFLVQAQSPALKKFVADQINRFWRTSAALALRFMDYGFLGCEVLYRAKENLIQFDRLKFLHPHTTRVVTVRGEYTGIAVTRVLRQDGVGGEVYIGRPKCWWGVHNRDQHIWYGRSRLRGAFLAWNEVWSHNGYRDQRRMWFFKNAFAGPKIGYPQGAAEPEEGSDGTPVPHRVIAQRLLDKMVAGTGVIYPNYATTGAGANGGWLIEDPKPIPIPEGLLEYGDQLRDEMWEGMGIPPEVARADGTGAFAGRRVPQQAFYSILQEIVQDIITDLDEQILRPLVRMNFGSYADYEIECFGLLRTNPQQEQNGVEEGMGDGLQQDGGGMGDGGSMSLTFTRHTPLVILKRPTGPLQFYANAAA